MVLAIIRFTIRC